MYFTYCPLIVVHFVLL